MLTTNGGGNTNSNYDALSYYLNCSSYDAAKRVKQYPFAAASVSVEADVARLRTAITNISAESTACSAIIATELSAAITEINTLTIGNTNAALLGPLGAAGGNNG